MRLIIDTEENLTSIQQQIQDQIGEVYLKRENWLVNNNDPSLFAIWCVDAYKTQIVSVIGQDAWDNAPIVPTDKPSDWFKPKPDKKTDN
tara:strand:- start:1871 stop:2137 length:267 start_codon:yes stop_codon:yes gene_type:complete